MKNVSFQTRLFMAEFYGTFLLIFLGFGSFYIFESLLLSSLLVGLSVFIASSIVSHISHAHFNPFISLAAFINQRITLKELGMYLFGQFSGSLFGVISLSLLSLSPSSIEVYNGFFRGLGAELFMTFILVYTYLAVSENKDKRILLGLSVGATYFLVLVISLNSGFLLLNPVRLLELLVGLEIAFFPRLLSHLASGIAGTLMASGFYYVLAYHPTKFQSKR